MRRNDGAGTHRHAPSDDRERPDVAPIADPGRRANWRGGAAGERPRDRVVRIDLDTCGDAAPRSDLEPARSIQESEWADPGMLADLHVAIDMARLVDAHPLAEAELAGTLPAIEEEIIKWQVAMKARPHLLREFVV